MKNKFERIVDFYPAYDKRSENPKKNYGISSVRIFFILKKGKKAVQFQFGTNWFLPETIEEYKKIGNKGKTSPTDLTKGKQLQGWSIDYHSPKPMFKGHESTSNECKITGGKCYMDGSCLYASANEEILLREGSEGIWKFLEKEWKERFQRKRKS